MKRQTLLGLVATLATIFFASLTTSPAFATSFTRNGVTCTQLTGSPLRPNIFNCTAQGTSQFSTGISGTQASAKAKLQPVGHFWEFDSIAAYQNFCGNTTGPLPLLPCSPILPGSIGQTVGHNSWIYTGGTFQSYPYGAAAAAHEEGHQLDLLYGGTLPDGNVLGVPASNSAQYKAMVDKDWANFNLKPKCSGTGVFYGLRDSDNEYICTGVDGRAGVGLTPKYSALTVNKDILQKAWAYYFFPGSAAHPQCSTGAYCELWAEEQKANLVGDIDNTMTWGSAVAFLKNGNFRCSLTFQSYLFTAGTLKVLSTYPPECQ